jgi:hypothetical protein
LQIEDFGGGSRRRARGDLCYLASRSLGHYAALSFVVIGRGLQVACGALAPFFLLFIKVNKKNT